MTEVDSFAWVVLGVSLATVAAILSNRISQHVRVPAPGLFLIGAAVASDLFPVLHTLPVVAVQHVVTAALALILFDGGMHLGWQRFRSAAVPIVWVGVVGTLLTAGAVALLAHAVLGLDWRLSLLLGTALAPTDPAVVFSVLGRREVIGRSGTLLEGESGANDPVGIALMVVLLAGGGSAGLGRLGAGVATFALQMAVGATVGLLGGLGLRWIMRHIALPSAGLYPLRTLAGVGILYGTATVAHGSGFLAVFAAGIVLGDANAPYKREVERFHSSLASLAEIVAFVVLGLTITLTELPADDAIWPGLLLAAALALLARPLLVGLVLLPVRLRAGERVFVLWAGLKGAVPVLLGTFVFATGLPGAGRVYQILFVVVAFSVVVQGSLVPLVARWCGVPMRVVEPEPWALGLRFRQEPSGLRRYRVADGAPADGTALRDLALDEGVWISLINRDGQVAPVGRDTVLRAGDEVLALTGTEDHTPDGVFQPRPSR